MRDMITAAWCKSTWRDSIACRQKVSVKQSSAAVAAAAKDDDDDFSFATQNKREREHDDDTFKECKPPDNNDGNNTNFVSECDVLPGSPAVVWKYL